MKIEEMTVQGALEKVHSNMFQVESVFEGRPYDLYEILDGRLDHGFLSDVLSWAVVIGYKNEDRISSRNINDFYFDSKSANEHAMDSLRNIWDDSRSEKFSRIGKNDADSVSLIDKKFTVFSFNNGFINDEEFESVISKLDS